MDSSTIKSLLNSTAGAITTSLKQATPKFMEYAQAHPIKTAFMGTGLIALPFGGTAAVAGSVLKCIGFGSAGPIVGKGENP